MIELILGSVGVVGFVALLGWALSSGNTDNPDRKRRDDA